MCNVMHTCVSVPFVFVFFFTFVFVLFLFFSFFLSFLISFFLFDFALLLQPSALTARDLESDFLVW